MTIKLTTDGHLCRLQLNVPERKNALSRGMLGQIGEALTSLESHIGGVVITGGAQIFSSGADFNDLRGDAGDFAYDNEVAKVTAIIRDLHCPVIAAIEGPCMGAAVDIALACDARVAGADAFMQVPAVKLGIVYNPDAVRRWMYEFGGPAIRDMLLLGRRLMAHEARAFGLINTVVDSGTACDSAADLIPESTPGAALTATKALLSAITSGDFDAGTWHVRRRELLESAERAHALSTAQRSPAGNRTNRNDRRHDL